MVWLRVQWYVPPFTLQVILLGTVRKGVCWKGGHGTHVANHFRLRRNNPGLKLFMGVFVKILSLFILKYNARLY